MKISATMFNPFASFDINICFSLAGLIFSNNLYKENDNIVSAAKKPKPIFKKIENAATPQAKKKYLFSLVVCRNKTKIRGINNNIYKRWVVIDSKYITKNPIVKMYFIFSFDLINKKRLAQIKTKDVARWKTIVSGKSFVGMEKNRKPNGP